MRKSTLNKCFLLVLLAWLLTSCSIVVANPIQSTSYKAIPTGTWEQLKQNNLQLELKLTEAKLQLEMLFKQSAEVKVKLTEAEKQLMVSKQELENSKLSLQSAKNLQQKARQSLSELTNQIDEERKKQEAIQSRLRIQRTFAYILLGLAIVNK